MLYPTEPIPDAFLTLYDNNSGFIKDHIFLWAGIIVIVVYILTGLSKSNSHAVNAPIVGYRSSFEPTWLLRLRFVRDSRLILQEGYDQFKDSMFKIRRIGTDVILLSNTQAEEIRRGLREMNGSTEPFMNDFVGDLTAGPTFLQSDLQTRVLQQKLTPNLARLVPIMKDELDFALKEELSVCNDWIEVDIVPIFVRIIARISARILVGPEQSRNEEWLATTTEYTENLFKSGMFLRMFPKCARTLIASLFPPYRKLRLNVKAARRIVGKVVTARRAAEMAQEEGYTKPTDVLQWMTDMAVGDERNLDNLAQRILILSLSSIHTTALTMSQALYDLIAHPEHIAPIKSEITKILRENHGWQKMTLDRFLKLDSLLKESQRFNPVFLVTFNRILHTQANLSDGTKLPSGTRIAVPSYHMLHDTRFVPGPMPASKFDPFRYSRLREDPEHPENAQKFLFSRVDSGNMAFGYGKHACPGRFFTSSEIQMVLAHMILKYEWMFPVGKQRPRNFTVDTDMFPDPAARVMVRRREHVDQDIANLL